MGDKPTITRELFDQYVRAWSEDWDLSLDAIGMLACLTLRDNPYDPTSIDELSEMSSGPRSVHIKAAAELTKRGFLEPADEAEHFLGFYPAGDAPYRGL